MEKIPQPEIPEIHADPDEPELPLSAQDSVWWRQMGGAWPDPEEEASWLEETNRLIQAGSSNLKHHKGADSEDEYSRNHQAREAFMLRLANGRADKVDLLYRTTNRRQSAILYRSEKVVGCLRELSESGVDLSGTWHHSHLLGARRKTIRERLDSLTAIGIDVKVVSLQLIGLSPAAIHERLRAMFAAARAFRLGPDYKRRVESFVSHYPNTLNYKPDRTRLLAQIACRTFDPTQEVDESALRSLYWYTPESFVMAYVKSQTSIRSLRGLLNHAQRYYKKWSREEMQGELMGLAPQFADDPAFKLYERAYPINDPEAAENARRRRARVRNRRQQEWDTWFNSRAESIAGSLLDVAIGGTGLTTEQSYRTIVNNTPPISRQEEIGLAKKVRAGHYAASKLGRDIKLSPEDRAKLLTEKSKGLAARNALVRANLYVVLQTVSRYRRAIHNASSLEMVDLIQAGNVGLVLAAEHFDPSSGVSFEDHARNEVRREVREEFAKQARTIRLPENIRQLVRSMIHANDDLTVYLGRSPTNAELAKEVGITVEKLAELQLQSQAIFSLDKSIGEDGGSVLSDIVAVDAKNDPAVLNLKFEFREAIRQLVDKLPFHYAAVVRLRYGLDCRTHTVEEVAGIIGEDVASTKRYEAEALARMRVRSGAAVSELRRDSGDP